MRLYINNILFLLLFCSCNPSTQDDIKKESQKITSNLLNDLKTIKNKEELYKKRIVLKKRFDELAKLMVEADKITQNEDLEDEENSYLNENLKIELLKIYNLDGGQEIIEQCQKNALRLLAEKNVAH
jgi:hypothetical protein